MKILRRATALPPDTAACIGAFDGLHLGHQALLRRAARVCPKIALVTFEPHPAQVLAPERAPAMIQSPGQRIRVAAQLGVDVLALLPFNLSVAALTPVAFVDQFLRGGLRPAAVVVGPDFRFGAGRAGGIPELRALLQRSGTEVLIAEEVPLPGGHAGAKLSSSQIRKAVGDGDVARAQVMLGRWFAVAGTVVHGHGRGRDLGFRTANLACTSGMLVPATGVYAVFLSIVDGPLAGQQFAAVANLGTNPTFGDTDRPTLEVHALDADFGEQLYGCAIEAGFVARLRNEQRFPGPQALKTQIAADIGQARQLLAPPAATKIQAAQLRPGSTT